MTCGSLGFTNDARQLLTDRGLGEGSNARAGGFVYETLSEIQLLYTKAYRPDLGLRAKVFSFDAALCPPDPLPIIKNQ